MNNYFLKIENIKDYVEDAVNSKKIRPQKYAKSAVITAVQGVVGEKISTIMSNGLHETDNIVTLDENTGNPGWIVTNTTGEKYIISDSVFCSKYEPIVGSNGIFKPKGNPISAIQINENISFTAPWGETQNIARGGYLVISDMNDIYGIQEEEFNKTYKVYLKISVHAVEVLNVLLKNIKEQSQSKDFSDQPNNRAWFDVGDFYNVERGRLDSVFKELKSLKVISYYHILGVGEGFVDFYIDWRNLIK